jgi:galactonate dehydratase
MKDKPLDYTRRASSPSQEHAFRRGPRITAIETLIPAEIMPGLMLLRVHTDGGTVDGQPLIGHGETYYAPHAVAAMLHDWMSRRLLGAEATAIESHWRFLYDRGSAFGVRGCELRAISAIDLALWDILGQLTRQPIWKLLGGPVRDRIPVYNSCGGPSYGRRGADAPDTQGWPGHGDLGKPGPLEDNWRSVYEPGELAKELVAEGCRGLKMWPFDRMYQEHGGHYVNPGQLKKAVASLAAVREAVGDSLEIMLDGHGFFSLPAAIRIAQAVREFKPLWLEDVIRPDSIDAIAAFRDAAGVPIAVSEMFVSREEYRLALEKRAADYVMTDPTWVGGISETRRVAEFAQVYNVPTLIHDCTGPLTLMAGVHVTAATANVMWQETVRAHVHTLYSLLLDEVPQIDKGAIELPMRPGLGVRLLDELFDPQNPGYRITKL